MTQQPPSFVSDYIAKLDELQRVKDERKELESPVITWLADQPRTAYTFRGDRLKLSTPVEYQPIRQGDLHSSLLSFFQTRLSPINANMAEAWAQEVTTIVWKARRSKRVKRIRRTHNGNEDSEHEDEIVQ